MLIAIGIVWAFLPAYMTENVSQLAQETENAASDVWGASSELSKHDTMLKDIVDEFLIEIRTG